MKLKVKDVGIKTGKIPRIILNNQDAKKLDLQTSDRVRIKRGKKSFVAAINIGLSSRIIKKGQVGLFHEAVKVLDLKNNDLIDVELEKPPLSLYYIKKKLEGQTLKADEIEKIIKDIVENKLTEPELTTFVVACYTELLSEKEGIALTKAMADTGEILKIGKQPILDKHCIGGIAGNRTTMVVVPIVAAAGLTIPKTSSRSITSAAGTADAMEVLAKVDLSINEIKRVVKKTNGCIVWGGALNLAPADDKLIEVEKPLNIDAPNQVVASVLAKKLSVSSTHVLIDIPYGKGAKIESRASAISLKNKFEKIGKAVGLKIKCVLTDGSKPIGFGIGPILEVRDVLKVLMNSEDAPQDLKNKSIKMAGDMLEMSGKFKKGSGQNIAKDLLISGKACKKMVEIIKSQGGKTPKLEKLIPGKFTFNYKASKTGKISFINSKILSKISRIAGSPEEPKAGIFLHKNSGDFVKKGEKIFTLYSESKEKLNFAKETFFHIGGIEIR